VLLLGRQNCCHLKIGPYRRMTDRPHPPEAPVFGAPLPNARPSQEAMDSLALRRSTPIALMTEPGPCPAEVDELLRVAARVPDHGKLAPWRFILYPAAHRQAAIDGLVAIAGRHPDEAERRRRAEKAKGFADAPLVVGVVSTADPAHPKIPLWEQQLSAGAVCTNLLHAASAHGFSAQWLTGWYGYDAEAKALLGLRDREQVAGFVHIGTAKMPPTQRDRPDVDALTSEWAGA
jgi:nitroreductase